MTLQQLQTSIFDHLEDEWTLSAEDSHAKLFQLLGSEGDSMTLEELYSLKSHVSPISSDHGIYSLKTSKGSLVMTGGATFETILRTLDELGYDAEWEVLNSKDFGIPQNRERIFIIGHLRGAGNAKIFPVNKGERTVDGISIQKRPRTNIAPLFYVSMPESTRRDIESRYYIRDLTPREYFRLQGFTDCQYNKASSVNEDVQLYKQAGNSVTVNVIYEIARRMR